jgi:hypothetical protein
MGTLKKIYNMKPDEFREFCISQFEFLVTDYDCEVSFPEAPSVPYPHNSYKIVFQNATTGVIISLEVIERMPTLHILQRHPTDLEHNVFTRFHPTHGECNIFPFRLLLLVRAPDLNPLRDESGLPLRKTVQTLIIEYAHALKIVAKDVLKGDFRVLPELQMEYRRVLNELP